MRLLVLPVCLLGAVGCTVDDKRPGGNDAAPSPDPTLAELNVRVAVVDATGATPELHTFAHADDVYISITIADQSKPVTPEDYVFQVINRDGTLLSNDDLGCRTIHVNARGVIDRSGGVNATGADCSHAISRAAEGSLFVQLVPFRESVADELGAMRFVVRVGTRAVCSSDDRFDHALFVPFAVHDASTEDPEHPEPDPDPDPDPEPEPEPEPGGGGGGGGDGRGNDDDGSGGNDDDDDDDDDDKPDKDEEKDKDGDGEEDDDDDDDGGPGGGGN